MAKVQTRRTQRRVQGSGISQMVFLAAINYFTKSSILKCCMAPRIAIVTISITAMISTNWYLNRLKAAVKTIILLKLNYAVGEQSFLMMGSGAEQILKQLKKFLSPGATFQKVQIPQYDLLKSLVTPNTKHKIARKVFVPLSQHYNNFLTPDNEQQHQNLPDF